MFKTKLRKIGNSVGVLLPRQVITNFKIGDEIMLEVITETKTSNKPIIHSDASGVDIHLNNAAANGGKKLVFNIKSGQNEWQ